MESIEKELLMVVDETSYSGKTYLEGKPLPSRLSDELMKAHHEAAAVLKHAKKS